MEILYYIFGQGKELAIYQMAARGIAVFLLAWLLLCLSGRRSFGIKTPFDNIIGILLGAVLSRAVVGASPAVPVIVTCIAIVLLHRISAWALIKNQKAMKVVEGEKILLFEQGVFKHENLRRALLCEEDVMQGVRKSALTEDLNKIERIYMERTGEITCIKKEFS